MRDLDFNELFLVSGAGHSPCPPSGGGSSPQPPSRTKNNNGYGNGAESGPAPGNSGSSNPQLTTANSGPRGAR
jgi:hypothetical protein